MNQEQIRIIREKQLVDTIIDHITEHKEFTVKFPDSYDNCCKITVDSYQFTVTYDEFLTLTKKITQK